MYRQLLVTFAVILLLPGCSTDETADNGQTPATVRADKKQPPPPAASETIEENLGDITGQLAEARGTLEKADGELRATGERVDSLNAGLADTREEATELRKKTEELVERISTFGESMKLARANSEDLNRQLASLREELAAAQQHEEELDNLVESLLQQLESAKNEVEALRNRSDATTQPTTNAAPSGSHGG